MSHNFTLHTVSQRLNHVFDNTYLVHVHTHTAVIETCYATLSCYVTNIFRHHEDNPDKFVNQNVVGIVDVSNNDAL
jgi:hypothetical protein